LSEQKLSGIGLQESLTLGKFLRADGILLLESARVKEKSPVTARLIATVPGVAVASGIFAGDSSEITAAVAGRFEPLWHKLTVARKDAVAISLLNPKTEVG
jgi:hypothetical protein